MKYNLYNWIEKDFWSKSDKKEYKIVIAAALRHPAMVLNKGWNLSLEDWEVGQVCGGN